MTGHTPMIISVATRWLLQAAVPQYLSAFVLARPCTRGRGTRCQSQAGH